MGPLASRTAAGGAMGKRGGALRREDPTAAHPGAASRQRRRAESALLGALRLLLLDRAAAALRGVAVLAHDAVAAAHDAAVHGARNGELHLVVHLGQLVQLVRRRLLEVAHGRLVDDVANVEALDGLVLRRAAA